MFLQIKDIKRIERDFVSMPVSCPRVGLEGAKGAQEVKKIEYGHVAYRIDGDDEKNSFTLWSNWWPWVRSKGQTSLNFNYKINFKDFYTKLCVCSHKLKI